MLMATPLFQEPLFAARVIYDLLFFFMVIIIVLNLIFGVIIDTFADLRSEKQKKEEILKTTCFICGECGSQPQQGSAGFLWERRCPPALASLALASGGLRFCLCRAVFGVPVNSL